MDQELLIIELLSAAEPIYRQAQKTRHKNLFFAFLYSVVFCSVFLGIGSFIYQRLNWQSGVIDSNYWSQGSIVWGILIAVLAGLFFCVNLIQGMILRRSFQRFLLRCVQKAEKYPFVYQDTNFYFLAEKTGTPKIRLPKEACSELLTTLDGASIYLGNRHIFWGLSSLQLVVLTEEPASIAIAASKKARVNHKWILIACLIFLGIIGTITQSRRYRQQVPSNVLPETSTVSREIPLSSDNLLTQQGTAPNRRTNQTNQLDLNNETHELYMTTDGGSSWSFVPLKPEWIRTGSYVLTSGEIPMGYWMDKSYTISADFSWFIYSENDKDLYFLASHDNGKTWQKSLVTNKENQMRYRKAQFFADGSGVLVYSTILESTSAEGVEIYQTTDFGKTWYEGTSVQVDRSVQNISFVDSMLGFVSTREKIYYTNNGGRTLKEAVVAIPKDYQTGGLDIFQSPNEVTQTGTSQLEAKFYLLKNSGDDSGTMFACLFRSSDNGESWQFVHQLSKVEPSE